MSFAVGAFSGGARGAGGGGGGGNKPQQQRGQQRNRQEHDGKDGRAIEGDVETPQTTTTPMATASLMWNAITSGIPFMNKENQK